MKVPKKMGKTLGKNFLGKIPPAGYFLKRKKVVNKSCKQPGEEGPGAT